MDSHRKAPPSVAAESEGQVVHSASSNCPTPESPSTDVWQARSVRRRLQVQHLHRCGPRCILEALRAVESGEPLDAVLADFERLPPEVYHAAIMLFCDGGV
jgi:hypothetical protein